MTQQRILVLAPHPDDELLGCGAYLAKAAAAGYPIRIIVVTDGGAGLPPGYGVADREAECRAGLALLGISDVQFWGYADGACPVSGEIADRYRQAVAEFGPHGLFLPAPGEQHPDHVRVTRGCLAALTQHWQGELWFYETLRPNPTVNLLIPIADMPGKLAALACHRSQMQDYDHAGHSAALARLRGFGTGTDYAEAFLQFPWEGDAQNFFDQTPLISIIIRARHNHFLQHALASLAAQDYPLTEVVLVWFGEDAPQLDAYRTLLIQEVPGMASRSENLNRGIDTATGEYIAILDEDDIVHPSHYSTLLAELKANPQADVAHSNCSLRSCRLVDGVVRRARSCASSSSPSMPTACCWAISFPSIACCSVARCCAAIASIWRCKPTRIGSCCSGWHWKATSSYMCRRRAANTGYSAMRPTSRSRKYMDRKAIWTARKPSVGWWWRI